MKKKLLIFIILILTGIFYLKVLSPKYGLHIPCIFNKVTGLDCPGCGITRASLALLDGDFYQAFRWNMLLFILAPIYGVYFFFEKKKYFRQSKYVIGVMLSITVLFFILRNTSIFAYLAPTYIG